MNDSTTTRYYQQATTGVLHATKSCSITSRTRYDHFLVDLTDTEAAQYKRCAKCFDVESSPVDEATTEALLDKRVQRRLASDSAYRNAENAEEQSEREHEIEREESARLGLTFDPIDAIETPRRPLLDMSNPLDASIQRLREDERERPLHDEHDDMIEIERDAKTLRVPMTHVARDDEYASVLRYRIAQEIASAEKRVAALRELDERVAAVTDSVVVNDAPRVHVFDSTSLAYDVSQCSDDVRNGDVLVVPDERAVAIMLSAWPCAIAPDMSGEHFHEAATSLNFASVPAIGVGPATDYSPSLALAEPIAKRIRESVEIVDVEHEYDCFVSDDDRDFGPPMSDAEAAYYAEREAEQQRLDALPRVSGCPAVDESGECESCGTTTVLYERVAYTLGYAGHPGAEQTAFHVCATCLTDPHSRSTSRSA